jgi:hypothetical protein
MGLKKSRKFDISNIGISANTIVQSMDHTTVAIARVVVLILGTWLQPHGIVDNRLKRGVGKK